MLGSLLAINEGAKKFKSKLEVGFGLLVPTVVVQIMSLISFSYLRLSIMN